MKKKIYKTIALLGIFLGLAVAGVRAQAPSRVEVKIPFEFSAGKTTLKAGVYTIKRISANNVALRSTNGQGSVILNAPVSLSSNDPNAIERLVFSKYGENYVLSQIWLTADSGREIWTQRKDEKPEQIVIALRNFAKK
jgi:hypothetical protein